jgi:hypothetical protein
LHGAVASYLLLICKRYAKRVALWAGFFCQCALLLQVLRIRSGKKVVMCFAAQLTTLQDLFTRRVIGLAPVLDFIERTKAAKAYIAIIKAADADAG